MRISRRIGRSLLQAVLIVVGGFGLAWLILVAVNPTQMFDQSSFPELSSGAFTTLAGAGWWQYAALFVAVALSGSLLARARPLTRTLIATTCAIVVAVLPLAIAQGMGETDTAALIILIYGILVWPIIVGALIASAATYYLILPGARPRRLR